MPIINHNRINLVNSIRKKIVEVKKITRRLRHSIEKGSVFIPPEKLLIQLAKETSELTELVNQYTIRNEWKKIEYSDREEFETPMQFVENEFHHNEEYVYTEVKWEREIYKGMGMDNEDYENLINWKNALNSNEVNLTAAYEEFSDKIINQIRDERIRIGFDRSILGIAGTVGIASDVTMFHEFQMIPAIVSSCITGISAMSREFRFVKRKLFI